MIPLMNMPASAVRPVLMAAAFVAIATLACRAQDKPASTDETAQSPGAAKFQACDQNSDGLLTEQEFLQAGGRDVRLVHRDFIVFDSNGDHRLNLAEFLTVPVGQPDDQRGAIFDPVTQLSETAMASLAAQWKKWDLDGDDLLSADEFSKGAVGRRIAGLEGTAFEDWDLDRDQRVSRTEAARVLDVAFGVRIPSGQLLRHKTGRVVDLLLFRRLKTDAQGLVSQEEYYRVLGLPAGEREGWFKSIDKNGDGQFDYAEFATGNHRTDPVGTFLLLDVDCSGRLSAAELEALPNGWRQMATAAFRGFDDDGDRVLTLREFQLMPHSNILASWSTAVDANQDGKLSRDEFQFVPGLQLSALTAEYFRRLDLDRDQTLSLDEWVFQTTHPEARYRTLDRDRDGRLTESEFIAEGSRPAKRLSRDFKVFDMDHNGVLSLTEFRNVPYWIAVDQRGPLPDPVVQILEKRCEEVAKNWAKWDVDGNSILDPKEFENAGIRNVVPGLEGTTFDDWDQNRDGRVWRVEVKQLLEVAYGVRTTRGELLRLKSGCIVDWRMFRDLKTDAEGFVSRQDYLQALGSLDIVEKQKWWNSVDRNHDDRTNYLEFSGSPHRTDPLSTFLDLDQDFDGQLSKEELDDLPPDRFPVKKYLFPGFDDDRDGKLSLAEFQLTPAINLLASWHAAVDADADGQLSLTEFRFSAGVELAALAGEYFRRFDLDQDHSLSLDEFPFTTAHVSAVENEIRAVAADGTTVIVTIPDYPTICSPEISPDGKWVAADGWKVGQRSVAAHVLVASLETDEVRDMGLGCIPHWSADGRRIGYSRYGQGVFIRDFEEPGNEVCVDPKGWSIHFSPDGLKTAFIQQQKQCNLIIHNIATGAKRPVFKTDGFPYVYIEHNFCWSPDSRRICFKGRRRDNTLEVGIVTVTDDEPMLRVRCDARTVQSDFAWHPDGKRIMFPRIAMDGNYVQLFEFDPDTDLPAIRYRGQSDKKNNGGESWSRDGKTLVYMSRH